MKQQSRPIDPNISRKVKLKHLEIQSEIEKRSADENLRLAKEREIKKRERNYDEKKEEMMRQAKELKNPDIISPKYNNPMDIDFREIQEPIQNSKNMNKYNNEINQNANQYNNKQFQDKQRGRQTVNQNLDSYHPEQKTFAYNLEGRKILNQDAYSEDLSSNTPINITSSEKRKKKRKGKTKKRTNDISRDLVETPIKNEQINKEVSSPTHSQSSAHQKLQIKKRDIVKSPERIRPNLNNDEKLQSNSQKFIQNHYQQFSKDIPQNIPQSIPQNIPQNPIPERIMFEDNSKMNIPKQQPPSNPPVQPMQSFLPSSVRRNSNTKPITKTPVKEQKKIDDDPFTGIGFSGSVKNAFDGKGFDTNLNLFHLDDNPSFANNNDKIINNINNDPFANEILSNKGEYAIKQEIFTPSKSQSSQSYESSVKKPPQSSLYNFDEGQNKNDNNDFNFDDINIDFNDLNLNDSPMPKPNLPPQTKVKQTVNSGMPIENSNSLFGFSEKSIPESSNKKVPSFKIENDSKMNMRSTPSEGIFNTVVPSNANPRQSEDFGFDFFEDNKSVNKFSRKPSNDYEIKLNQFSAEPKVIPSSYPQKPNSQDPFGGLFNTVVPVKQQENKIFNQNPGLINKQQNIAHQEINSNNYGANNYLMPPVFNSGMNSTGNVAEAAALKNKNQYVDPFGAADSLGYNMGGFSAGFNTMNPSKQKKKNPFSKKSDTHSNNFPTNTFVGSPKGSGGIGIFNDMFGSSSDFSKTSQFGTSNIANNTQYNGNQNMFSTVNYKNNQFTADPFAQMNNPAPQNYNMNTQYNNMYNAGGATQKIQVTGNELDDLFS